MDITAAELKERLENGDDLHLLDVRGELEYHTYNIGGLNIPLPKLNDEVVELDWNKNEEIIVICKVGMRSNTGKLILQQNGYTNVKNLKGGLIALQKSDSKH